MASGWLIRLSWILQLLLLQLSVLQLGPCRGQGHAALRRDLADLRCPVQSLSISHARFEVGTRQLWPAVLELLDLGLKAVFQVKDLPKARALIADALDLAQGRWDYGTSAEATQETVALLLNMGFPVSSSPVASASPSPQGLERAFGECPLALATAYRALCLTHLADGKARESKSSWARAIAIAQRFQHLGYGWLIKLYNEGAAKQDPAYIDLSPWPITGEEWETERDFVAKSLKDLGRATSPARPQVSKSWRIPGLSVALVTVCAYPEGSMLPHYAASVHKTYAERHGYTYIHHRDEEEHLSAGRPKAWSKVTALHAALEDGRWDWVLWADCDIYFMDLQTTLDSLLIRYALRKNFEATVPFERIAEHGKSALDPDVHLVITEDAQALNTAIFLMRSSSWSLQLLRRAWGMDDNAAVSPLILPSTWAQVSSPFRNHPWWEQPAFTQQLLGTNHRRFQKMPYPQVDVTSGSLMVPYPEQVVIVPQMEMNSYHVISSRLDADTTWTPGKFVMSFNGIKSASGPAVAQVVASNYYKVFCDLNGLQDRCAADLIAFFQQTRPTLWQELNSGHGEISAVEQALFAPWMLQKTPELASVPKR